MVIRLDTEKRKAMIEQLQNIFERRHLNPVQIGKIEDLLDEIEEIKYHSGYTQGYDDGYTDFSQQNQIIFPEEDIGEQS